MVMQIGRDNPGSVKSSASPTQLVFNATSDTTIDKKDSTSQAKLKQLFTGKNTRALVSFNINNIPENMRVKSAKLRLHVAEGEGAAKLNTAKGSFNDENVSWDSAPEMGDEVGKVDGKAANGQGYVDVDVTGVVGQNGEFNWFLTGKKGEKLSLDSIESGRGPQLVVELEPKGPPPGEPFPNHPPGPVDPEPGTPTQPSTGGGGKSDFALFAADPQLGKRPKGKDGMSALEVEIKNLGKLIDVANKVKPKFLAICGDCVQQTFGQKGNDEQVKLFKQELNKLDKSIPIRLVPGNHDVEDKGKAPSAKSMAWYEQTYAEYGAKLNYSFVEGKTAYVVLNSTLIKKPENVQGEYDKQLSWFQSELDKFDKPGAGVDNVVVLQHHPWFEKDVNEKTDRENMWALPTEERKKFLDIMDKHEKVTAVFSGHMHDQRNPITEGHITHFNLSSTGSAKDGNDGFSKVWIDGNNKAHSQWINFEGYSDDVFDSAETENAG